MSRPENTSPELELVPLNLPPRHEDLPGMSGHSWFGIGILGLAVGAAIGIYFNPTAGLLTALGITPISFHIGDRRYDEERRNEEANRERARPGFPIQLEILIGLKNEVTNDEFVTAFNDIFAKENFNLSALMLDAKKFENGKNNLLLILENGLPYDDKQNALEDPKFTQLLALAFTFGFLKSEAKKEISEFHFPNLDWEDLGKKYQNFCAGFLFYCNSKYGPEATNKRSRTAS